MILCAGKRSAPHNVRKIAFAVYIQAQGGQELPSLKIWYTVRFYASRF